MDITADKFTERETDALMTQLVARELKTRSGRGGGSPYSPETVVVCHEQAMAHGTRVTIQPLACCHNGAGNYKGRGRTRTIVLMQEAADGAWAVCEATDRDAEEIGYSEVYLRPWATEEAEQNTGGLGNLASMLAGLKLDLPAEPTPVIVTRHPALAQVLREDAVVPEATPVIEHATADNVRGRHVYGVLPLHLAAEADRLTTVDLDLPAELRGQELTVEQVRQYRTGSTTYLVVRE